MDKIAITTTGLVYPASAQTVGTVTKLALSSVNTKVQASTSHVFVFKPKHPLTIKAIIKITLPSQFQPLSTCAVSASNLDVTTACTVAGHIVTIKNGFAGAPYSPLVTTGDFSITMAVTANPLSQAPIGEMKVDTYENPVTGEEYIVDKGTASALTTFTTGSLSDFTITPANLVADKTGVMYTFVFKAENGIPIGGKLDVTIPPTIILPDGTITCAIVNGFGTGGALTCTSASNKITILGGFPAQTAAAATHTFSLSGL
jgi:hypothetical protein